MEFFKIRRDIPFMKNALIFNAISFLTFAAAVFFLLTRGWSSSRRRRSCATSRCWPTWT